jgi:hypothetical protein
MKLLIFILSFASTVNAVDIPTVDLKKQTAANYAKAEATNEEQFKIEFENFIQLLEKNLVHREKAIRFLKMKKDDLLNGQSYQNWVLRIHRSAGSYLEMRLQYLQIISKYSVYRDLWLSKKHSLLAKKKLMMALASSLQLYDNFFSLTDVAEQNSDVRTLLNQGDATNNIPEDVLELLAEEAKSITLRSALASQVAGYEDFIKTLQPQQIDEQIHYLASVITSSDSYKLFRQGKIDRVMKFIGIRLGDGANYVGDGVSSGIRHTMNGLSKGFGNTVGIVATREGKMHPTQQPGLGKIISAELKPLDILLEKTPFRLTDSFIPGHWGHVAIWIGSKEQLMQEGLWDLIVSENQPAWHNMPADKRDRIINALSNGKVILEALRPGVEINSIDNFLNIDDFLAVRPAYLGDDRIKKAELIAQALTHFEKEYDFNFDVKTADKIVCSELAYWTFPDIPWITEVVAGRDSISPDNVIQTVMKRSEFETIMLFHDGKRVAPANRNFKAELCSLQTDSTLAHVNKECR